MDKQKSARSIPRFTWIALLGLAMISAALVWVLRSTLPSNPIVANTTEALDAIAQLRVPPRAAADAAHTHDVPLALRFRGDDDFKQNQHWFEAGQLQANGRFSASVTPLVLDQSCMSEARLQHASLEAAISQQLGFDVSQATPEDILVEDFAQFWQQDGRFFKLGGRWDRRMPAMYDVNYFSAAEAGFSLDVQNLPPPLALTGSLDIVSLGEYVDRVLLQAEQAGAVRGARLVQARPEAGGPAHDLKLNNGRPISWAFGTGRCQRRNSGSAFCKCAVGAELAAINHPAVPTAVPAAVAKLDPSRNHAANPEATKDENHVID